MKLILLLFLIAPCSAFSFSESELESLEHSNTKAFSKSLWRKDIGFSLIRNLDIETRYKNFSETEDSPENNLNTFCNPEIEGSLCDLSNLYYKMDFTVYYSLAQWAQKYLNYFFLQDTEFFLSSFFTSNFKGGACSNSESFDTLQGYIKCGIGDITGGWTSLIYKKNKLFNYFNFSVILPLSKQSKDTTLKTAFEGAINALYFIKKQNNWSGAVSSKHSLIYNHFTEPKVGEKGVKYNNPIGSKQNFNLIFKQNFNKYSPNRIILSVIYNFTINTENTYWVAHDIEQSQTQYWDIVDDSHQKYLDTVVKKKCPQSKIKSIIICGNRYHYLTLGLSSSWKLDQRVYLAFSTKWSDLISVHNPFNKKVKLKKAPSIALNNWYFTLRASYSF